MIPPRMPVLRRRPSTAIARGFVLAGLLLQAACVAGDGCGPIQRVLTASGEIRDERTVLATATVTVTEQQGDPSTLRAHVTGTPGTSGAPLRGHLLGARLVNADGDTIRNFRIILPPAESDEVMAVAPASPGDLDAVKHVLRRRRGVLLLDTGLAGRERIAVPLTRVDVGGWRRIPCG